MTRLSITQTMLSMLAMLVSGGLAYPIFGVKRYQRAGAAAAAAMAAGQPASLAYYAPAPGYFEPTYGGYDDISYYQPRRERFHSYGIPILHGEYKPTSYYYAEEPSLTYSDDHLEPSNPLDDLHEEMREEDERERIRETAMPTGQEVWYESPGRQHDSLSRANAAFLRNLMVYNTQMHKAEAERASDYAEDYGDDSATPDWYEPAGKTAYESPYGAKSTLRVDHPNMDAPEEDEEVKELRALVNKHRKDHDAFYNNEPSLAWQQLDTPAAFEPEPEYDDAWINWDSKRSVEPKKERRPTIHVGAAAASSTTTSTPETPTSTPKPIIVDEAGKALHILGGQKEIVLPRPANPVRHPFTAPVMNALEQHEKSKATTTAAAATRKQSDGAIYDTIKQILAMEQRLEKNPTSFTGNADSVVAQPTRLQKRYVSNEESLVQELDGLKRREA